MVGVVVGVIDEAGLIGVVSKETGLVGVVLGWGWLWRH